MGDGSRPTPRVRQTVANNDFAELEEKFNRIEAVVAEGRAASLGRIRSLEEEVASLKEAAELQTQFLSAISHEIRTPLSAIVSSARIIQRYHAKRPEVVARFGETIVIEGNRLVGTITDILDLVKIEAGRLEWHDEQLRADRVVAKLAPALAQSAAQHGVGFEIDVPADLPVAWADPDRIQQVLGNLVRNAIKFTPNGGRVRLVARRSPDGGLTFSVADTGVGIDAIELVHLFDKSHALKRRKAKDAKQAGTGLGLALCREIVHRHGGTIWADSKPGVGSTFHFSLPHVADERIMLPAIEGGVGRARVLLLLKNAVLSDCALRALRLEDIDARVCESMPEFFTTIADWVPEIVVVAPTFVWQFNDQTEQRIRQAGVARILICSDREGLVEMSPPTQGEPLLAALGQLALPGASILLVEDDAEYGAVVEFELSQAGYEVMKAYNGLDAVELISAEGPDALVLDLALPQLDGFGVLARMREQRLRIPTVVLTSLDDETLDHRLTTMGASAIFRKYELIQPSANGALAVVKRILAPILTSGDQQASSTAPPSA
jgi:signal transduction histidine kinase/CheY-like chemotaxis protein